MRIPAGQRALSLYLTLADYRVIEREATARGVSRSKCVADCLREYFALKQDLASAVHTPGPAGAEQRSLIIHSLLARSEERIAASIDSQARQTAQLRQEIRLLHTMLDRAMLSYLAHTPEVPDGVAAGALASAHRRHHLWLRAVQEILAEGPYRILDQLSGPDDQDTTLGDPHDA
jgi:hypothetical protein